MLSNSGYFLKEVKTMIRLNLLSNSLTVFSTGLIFFMLAMVISGWWVSNQVVKTIQSDAEISVYLKETIADKAPDVRQMAEKIKAVEGVQGVRIVTKDEAYARMEEILGKEAGVLNNFEANPFSSFLELTINLDQIDPVLTKVSQLDGIDYVRDNREVLDRLRTIANVVRIVGLLVLTAVGISTLVIISHIIRLGMASNRDQIETLRLLGAPESFIALPFLLEGLLLTLGGGLLATILAVLALQRFYALLAGPLPFLPLPPQEVLSWGIAGAVMSISAVLGITGSWLGFRSVKDY